MKKGYTIHTISINDTIVIFGHRFNGLADIRQAVQIYMREDWDPFPAKGNLYQPVNGLSVLCNYEPYPTFDEYDAMCENRDYENYYFLDRPFTKNETDAVATVYPRMDFCKVYKGMKMPFDSVVIYYGGYGGTMLVAYPEESNNVKIPGCAITRFIHRMIMKLF